MVTLFFASFSRIVSGNWAKPYITFHNNMLKIGFHSYNTFKSNPAKVKLTKPLILTYRYMAGHAKWQNTKHIKAEKDRQKALLCNRYVRLVTAAIREKGPDPKQNNKLSQIMVNAKKDNVPSATIESAVKKAASKKFQSGVIEMLGPGGFICVLEYETDNVSEMRRTVKIICKRYSAGIFTGSSERWRCAYEQKGIIKVFTDINGAIPDNEKILDAAIEAGAEDVQKHEEEGNIFYEFMCSPDDIFEVKKELEKNYSVEEASVAYLPITTVKLSDEDKVHAVNFLNELANMPDVLKLYENIE